MISLRIFKLRMSQIMDLPMITMTMMTVTVTERFPS